MRAEMIRIMLQGMLRFRECVPAVAGLASPPGMVLALALCLSVCGCGESSANYHSSVLALHSASMRSRRNRSTCQPVWSGIRLDPTTACSCTRSQSQTGDGKIIGQTGAVFPGRRVTTARPFRLTPARIASYDRARLCRPWGLWDARGLWRDRNCGALGRLPTQRRGRLIGAVCPQAPGSRRRAPRRP